MTPPAAAVPDGRVTGPAVHLRRPGPAAGSTRPQWSRAAIAARPAGQGSGAPAWRPKAQHGWCDHPAFQDRNVTFTLFVPEPSRLATALPETPIRTQTIVCVTHEAILVFPQGNAVTQPAHPLVTLPVVIVGSPDRDGSEHEAPS